MRCDSKAAPHTLGEHGNLIVNPSIVLQNVGSVCSYVLLVVGLTTSVLEEWIGLEAGDIVHSWASFFFITPLMVALLVLPQCLVRHLSNLWCESGLKLIPEVAK